jgi:hypothetical protein
MSGIINVAGEVSTEAELKAGENSAPVEFGIKGAFGAARPVTGRKTPNAVTAGTQASSKATMSFNNDCSTTSDKAG